MYFLIFSNSIHVIWMHLFFMYVLYFAYMMDLSSWLVVDAYT